MGWSLNLPAIERKNPSGFPRFIDGPPGPPGPDPTKDPDDFVFAGEPLVPICVISAQGGCSADPSLSNLVSFAGYTYFRTEKDNFTRFFYSARHTDWVVESQSGAWMYFGEFGGDSSALETHDIDVSADATTLIYRWNLSRIVDEVGNTVVYKWAALDSTDDGFSGGDQPTSASGPGLKYLTDIYDTPTTNISRAAPAVRLTTRTIRRSFGGAPTGLASTRRGGRAFTHGSSATSSSPARPSLPRASGPSFGSTTWTIPERRRTPSGI